MADDNDPSPLGESMAEATQGPPFFKDAPNQLTSEPRSYFDQDVEVTVTIRGLDGPRGMHTYTNRVSHEFAVDANLETPLIERAAVEAVWKIAEKALGDARHEKRERERLEMMVGGPITAARMAAHLSQLLDQAGGGEASEHG